TTTLAPLITSTTAPPTTAKPATTTTAKPAATTTTTASDNGVTITINSDNSQLPQFSPAQQAVYVGTLVRWVNHDTATRSVVGANNAFRSPDIPPGQQWSYLANKAGDYNYQDGTRPYANGTLQVLNR